MPTMSKYGEEILESWSCPWCDADNAGPLRLIIDDIDERTVNCPTCGKTAIVRGDYMQESGYIYWLDKAD